MSRYSDFERAAARFLDSAPNLKRGAKWLYKRAIYLLYREVDVKQLTPPDVKVSLVCEGRGRRLGGDVFFGYYDKRPWSFDSRSLLMHHYKGGEKLEVVELRRGNTDPKKLGSTPAWNWQQGSMAQWLTNRTVVFNTVKNRRLGSQIVDTISRSRRFIPWPVQSVHPSGREAISLNYKRLYKIRPEYGYSVKVKNFSPDLPLAEDGVWRVNMRSGGAKLIITLAKLRDYKPRPEMEGAMHKVNHAMYSPTGDHFVFMHRWVGSRGKFSRLYVASTDGKKMRLLMDDRMVSHYSWRDENNIIVWGRTELQGDHYYNLNIKKGVTELVGKGVLDQFGDGHPSFSPDGRWIVTDTYPDKARQRRLLLFDTKKEQCFEIGRFFAPWHFDGAKRCDLHPRWSPDGGLISVDSAHDGKRKSYIVDIRKIVDNGN